MEARVWAAPVLVGGTEALVDTSGVQLLATPLGCLPHSPDLRNIAPSGFASFLEAGRELPTSLGLRSTVPSGPAVE